LACMLSRARSRHLLDDSSRSAQAKSRPSWSAHDIRCSGAAPARDAPGRGFRAVNVHFGSRVCETKPAGAAHLHAIRGGLRSRSSTTSGECLDMDEYALTAEARRNKSESLIVSPFDNSSLVPQIRYSPPLSFAPQSLRGSDARHHGRTARQALADFHDAR